MLLYFMQSVSLRDKLHVMLKSIFQEKIGNVTILSSAELYQKVEKVKAKSS